MPEPIVRLWFDDATHFLDVPESHAFEHILVSKVDLIEWLWPRYDVVRPEELL